MHITPETKVSELLEHYPQLESLLIKLSPPLAALKNNMLRKPLSQATTLRQAAKGGKVDVAELVNTLREKVSQRSLDACQLADEIDFCSTSAHARRGENIVHRLDVRPMLAAGNHPKDEVLLQASKLRFGETLEFIAPFLPTPLIELLQKQGFKVDVSIRDNGTVHTYVTK